MLTLLGFWYVFNAKEEESRSKSLDQEWNFDLSGKNDFLLTTGIIIKWIAEKNVPIINLHLAVYVQFYNFVQSVKKKTNAAF